MSTELNEYKLKYEKLDVNFKAQKVRYLFLLTFSVRLLVDRSPILHLSTSFSTIVLLFCS